MSSQARSIAAFATVMLAFFMAVLDTSIVNITLPLITEYFKTDIKTISWVVNGFNLAFAIPLITASRLADQFGRKRIFIIGLSLFTVTSFLAGISPSEKLLVLFRVLQGLSAAALVPVTLPIVLRLFPAEKSGTVIGVWAAIAGLAAASGPALGGIISDQLTWQWIFYINIPIGILTLILTVFLIDESNDPTASRYIDWPGMIALSVGAFALVYGLIKANDWGWSSSSILGLFAVAAVAIIAFAQIERRTKDPMLPLHMLRSVPFSMSNLTMFMLGMGMMNGVFFLAFFLTRVMGMSELKAGIIITALPLSSTIFSGIAGLLSDKVGSRPFAVLGMTVVMASVFIYSTLTPDASNRDIIWRLMVGGAGIGLAMAPLVGATVRSVSADKIGIASGVGNMARTIGTVLGVAIIVTVFTTYVEKQIEWAKAEAIADVSANKALKTQIKDPILKQLGAVSFSGARGVPSVDQVITQMDQKQKDVMGDVPEFMQKKMKKVFAQQKDEVRKMYPALEARFKNRMCDAFAATYRVNGFILILGILFALFCEPRRRA